MEIKCLKCGKPVPQTPGKRKKEYCGSTCRSLHWKEKQQAGKPKKGPGRPKKNTDTVAPEMTKKIDFKPTPPYEYDDSKAMVVSDEPAVYQIAEVVSSTINLPTKPYDLKKMAEAGVPDKEAFKRHVESTKMTPGERSLILSKLK